ncbi:HemK family protein methyltransferase [Candidatus Nardonella dryophthoridicola]|uniref:Release factor glutamine methyltransferase n=1 Tax=endosymbiont of Rhynchophorus ferrugineus TaxID=1972133 RepID=A0A2Z5T428_9GAMM|nr:HemK family protein methyltransferase [Candidatus Nardonella dryophthoridicola]BBA85147.1 release factor glutamine methyltransferase [endosymbiont of Rhynchophorus ferrugineus]
MYYREWLFFFFYKNINFFRIKNININYIDNFICKNLLYYKFKNKNKIYLDFFLSYKDLFLLNNFLLKILNYENIEYINKYTYFYGLKIFINNKVFVPRIETECLIDFILNYIKNNRFYKILDLGSGSGNISLVLSKLIEKSKVLGIDINLDSILLSKINKNRLNINNVNFKLNNWYYFSSNYLYDIIISNPPYININDFNYINNNILYENFNSIFSKNNGLYDIYYIINNFSKFLKSNGLLILEHFNNHKKIKYIFKKTKKFKKIYSLKDFNNIYRFTFGIKY